VISSNSLLAVGRACGSMTASPLRARVSTPWAV
jgi:hypothetical protein